MLRSGEAAAGRVSVFTKPRMTEVKILDESSSCLSRSDNRLRNSKRGPIMYEFHKSPSSRLSTSKAAVSLREDLMIFSETSMAIEGNSPILQTSRKIEIDTVIEITPAKKLFEREERKLVGGLAMFKFELVRGSHVVVRVIFKLMIIVWMIETVYFD